MLHIIRFQNHEDFCHIARLSGAIDEPHPSGLNHPPVSLQISTAGILPSVHMPKLCQASLGHLEAPATPLIPRG